MSQQKGQENIDKFNTWKSKQDKQSIIDISDRGSLKISELAKTLNIARSAFYQSQKLKELVKDFTEDCRKRGWLPSKVNGADHQCGQDSHDIKMRDKNKSKLKSLEVENNKLREQVLFLKAQLKRMEKKEQLLNQYLEL